MPARYRQRLLAVHQFGKYETTTDRKIPVIRLTPDRAAL